MYYSQISTVLAWTHQSCQETRYIRVDIILPTPKRQTVINSISVAWQAKCTQTASPGFIVSTGSVEPNIN